MLCARCREAKKDDKPLVIHREPCYNKARKIDAHGEGQYARTHDDMAVFASGKTAAMKRIIA